MNDLKVTSKMIFHLGQDWTVVIYKLQNVLFKAYVYSTYTGVNSLRYVTSCYVGNEGQQGATDDAFSYIRRFKLINASLI